MPTNKPAAVADRQTPGHWEADLMLFRLYGQVILALHERHSRLLLAARLPGKAAAPIAHRLATLFAPLPPTWRQTVTFDNGTEFAQHHTLHALGLETFFCDPHAPWQKGGIRHVTASAIRRPPRFFTTTCCTSNVNPHLYIIVDDMIRYHRHVEISPFVQDCDVPLSSRSCS